MCFWGYGPSLWFLGHRPSIYTCLVCFSVRVCPKRICGMIFMILSPVGGNRTLCILLLYTMSLYKGKKRFDKTGILDIKCHTKKTETGQFLHMQVLMPSANHLRLFPSRWDRLLCKKTNKNNNNNLDTFVEKKGFFMEKLSARGYNDAELSRADSSINFEDRQHFIKEKLKSTAIPLVFNTKYNSNFAGKYIRQALLKNWHVMDKNVRLKMIFPNPPMIAYSRSENLCDSLVRAKFPTREEGDYSYDDLLRNEEDPPSSPTLQTFQDLEPESSSSNMFIDFEITEDQNTPVPTPSSRRQDHKAHSSCPFQADTHGEIYQTSIDDGLCPELIKVRDHTLGSTWLRKNSYIKIHARNISRSWHFKRQDLRGSKQTGLRQATYGRAIVFCIHSPETRV